MGIFSSLFGFGDKPTTTSSNVIPKYPEELKPYIEEAMKANQEIYKQRLEGGYQPYTGQTIAGFTPEEIASQEGLKSLVGTQAPLQQEALDLARGTARQFTPETAQEYMSPYLRTALDAQKQEAQRQYERTAVPQFEADAVRAGGMSGLGSRAGVEAAERDTGQNRLLANIEAQGQQKAFEAAQDAFRDQTARERQAAAQISTAAPNIFKSALSEQGLLQTMGEQKRDLGQSTLDEAYLKYVEQQQFPESQLARYQSSIYGNPLLKQPSYNKTGTSSGGGPGLGKTLLGLGTTALGFGSGGVGSSLFKSLVPSAGGGGIGSTMKAQEYINRNMGGPVMPIVYRQTNGSIRSGGGYDYNNMLKDKDKGLSEAEIAIKKGKNLKKIAEAFKNIPKYNAPSRVGGLGRGSVSSPLPTVEAQPNRQTTATDRAGLASLEGLTDAQLKEAYASEAQQLRRDDPNSVLSQSKNEMALIAGLDPQAGRDFAEFGTDESRDPNTELQNKLLDLQSLAAGTDSTTSEQKLKDKYEGEKGIQISVNAAKDSALEGIKTAQEIAGMSKAGNNKNVKLLNDFAERFKKRISKDPYKMQKFWFTVGANIMKKGNAFANMADGLRIAVNDLDATRKEKDKLLMDLEETMVKGQTNLNNDLTKSKTTEAGAKGLENKRLKGLSEVARKRYMELKASGISDRLAYAKATQAEAALLREQNKNKPKPFKLNEPIQFVNDQLEGIANLPDFANAKPLHDGAIAFKSTLATIVRSAGGDAQKAQALSNAAFKKWRGLSKDQRKKFKG
jgi:hypothetical protein